MTDNPRDTQFAGFAKLLFDDLSQMGLISIADPRNFPDQPDLVVKLQAEMNALTQQIITRRAYDLVAHTCEEVEVLESDARLTRDALLQRIPDLTTWPEVANDR